MTAGARAAFAGEPRLGPHGRVRRGWAPRGAKARQRVQLRCRWRWLVLAVEPGAGAMAWRWPPNLKKEAVAEAEAARKAAGVAALVWDGAPGRRAKAVRAAGPALATQPPAAPELTPPERVFQEPRRAGEGLVYATLEEQAAAGEREPTALAAATARLTRLVGWTWTADNLARLPALEYPAPS